MRITRLRFRIAETIFAPAAIILFDGMIHVLEGQPFMSEFLTGAVCAVFIIRGFDAVRAWQNVWPEYEPPTPSGSERTK